MDGGREGGEKYDTQKGTRKGKECRELMLGASQRVEGVKENEESEKQQARQNHFLSRGN